LGTERILVIGGAGFVGSATAARLAAASHEVTVYDAFRRVSDPLMEDWSAALAYRRTLLRDCGIVRGDAACALELSRTLDKVRPDRIIHLGGMASPPLNDLKVVAAVEAAVLPVTNILQLASRFGVKRFLFVSSSYVYGNFAYSPCDEAHPCNPSSVYGAVKLSAEVLTRALGARFGVPTTVARLTAVYGPGDLNGKLSVQNLRQAVTEGVLAIGGTAGEVSDYTYVDDAADGLCRALIAERAAGETINLARSRGWTTAEVVQALEALGCRARPMASKVTGRPKRAILAIDKARCLLGFDPGIDIEAGLARCLKFITSHRSRNLWHAS
jgi:nucleoside-diphosphate-sugar epimerase